MGALLEQFSVASKIATCGSDRLLRGLDFDVERRVECVDIRSR